MFAILKAVLDYIENRVAENISVEEVAGVAGFSTFHFRVVFRDATGQTLARYIKYRKICHAALRLISTEERVVDIAMSYGFSSHDLFTRAFRRTFGETSSQFRGNMYSVKSTVIVPGIFGPSVFNKEEISLKMIILIQNRMGVLFYMVYLVSVIIWKREKLLLLYHLYVLA